MLSTTEDTALKGMIEKQTGETIPRAGDAVLCRNTRPLVSIAYHCIRNRVGVTIEGRDIGKRIIKILPDLIGFLKSFAPEETNKP